MTEKQFKTITTCMGLIGVLSGTLILMAERTPQVVASSGDSSETISIEVKAKSLDKVVVESPSSGDLDQFFGEAEKPIQVAPPLSKSPVTEAVEVPKAIAKSIPSIPQEPIENHVEQASLEEIAPKRKPLVVKTEAKILAEPPNSKSVSVATTTANPRSIKTLDQFLGDKSFDVFAVTSQEFEQNYLASFKAEWSSNLKKSARSAVAQSFNGIPSSETIFAFRNSKLSKLTMLIYNKGDNAELSKQTFEKVQKLSIDAVKKLVGADANYKPNAGIAQNHLYWWATDQYLIKVESNFTETRNSFSSEYLRISFSPAIPGVNAVNIDKINNDVLTDGELKAMVSKEKSAVVIQGIPMVDQGQKGYCACAATARILNYYGRDIDQHDIAKLAVSSSMGTNPDDLKKALENISAKLRLNIDTIVRCYLGNDRDYDRLVTKVNREFEKQGFVAQNGRIKIEDLKTIFNNMAMSDNRYKDFKKGVINSIDKGRPLAWALYLGIIPELDIPQAQGGHMRLIIGYDDTKNEIYYSDSWGAGHEKKIIDMASAFYVSMALWEIRPR